MTNQTKQTSEQECHCHDDVVCDLHAAQIINATQDGSEEILRIFEPEETKAVRQSINLWLDRLEALQ